MRPTDKNAQKLDKRETGHAVVYKTSISHFMVKNTARKDKDEKGKFKRMLSFLLWTKEGFSLQNCP